MLLAWSALFRNAGTFQNYLSFVRTGCMLVKAPTEVFKDPSLIKAKATIRKAERVECRDPMWIR
eukprot:4465473-Karenia_brevis.AAC.1